MQYLGIEGALGRFTGALNVATVRSSAHRRFCSQASTLSCRKRRSLTRVPRSSVRLMSRIALSKLAADASSSAEAIAAAEARNPKLSLPRAVRVVWIRVLLFYVASTAVIGLIVASNDPRLGRQDGTAMSSPFVVAIRNSGIRGLHHLINAAILTSALSAASSNLYTSSRTIFGMALNGQAPAYLAKTSSWGLPWVSLSVSIVIGLLSFMSAGTADAATVFGWVSPRLTAEEPTALTLSDAASADGLFQRSVHVVGHLHYLSSCVRSLPRRWLMLTARPSRFLLRRPSSRDLPHTLPK